MKRLGYILSIYLLLVAVIPCCAMNDCTESEPNTEQAGNDENKKQDCGICSPFFNCESCSPVSIYYSFLHFNQAPVLSEKVYTGFIPSFISPVYYEYWQPPKIG